MQLKLGEYKVDSNMINTTLRSYYNYTMPDSFTGYYDKMAVSAFGSIAVQIYGTVYVFLVNPENDSAYLYDKFDIYKLGNWPNDIKWHPTER